MKQRATIDQQIDALKRRGITFELMTEEGARAFLERNSYFFKLKAYRNNYERIYPDKVSDIDSCESEIESCYDFTFKDLDFGHLVELSNIDFRLSRLCLMMCLAVEHAVKVKTNQLFMEDSNADIAELCVRRAFSGSLPESHDNPYTDHLREEKGPHFDAWHLWELMPFSGHLRLYEAYYQRSGKEAPLRDLLFIVRKLRNAVSHGNCLLVNTARLAPAKSRGSKSAVDISVTRKAEELCSRSSRNKSSRASAFRKALDRLVVNNYAAILLCHLEFVQSTGALSYTIHQVEDFVERVERNRNKYFGNAGLRQQRNRDVDITLTSLVILSRGYITHAKAKLEALKQ